MKIIHKLLFNVRQWLKCTNKNLIREKYMSVDTLRIATRQSPLALWQANYVKNRLNAHYPDLKIELVGITTTGDKEQSVSLAAFGGKGLFVKELQQALLDNRADIAVHCIKDMSVYPNTRFTLAAVLERADARDVFLSNHCNFLGDLAEGAVVGTSSPRRECLIKSYYPNLKIKPLRGNVDTRLRKLDSGDYDAMVLAAAGLERLGLKNRITEYLDIHTFVPAIGQGALGIECCADNVECIRLVQPLHHVNTGICVLTEQTVNQKIQGDCETPIGAHARMLNDDEIEIHAVVGTTDGKRKITSYVAGNIKYSEKLGIKVAEDLIEKGALSILKCARAR